MDRANRAVRGLPSVALAAAGVVLGHWLGYLWSVPRDRLRVELLAQSGHGYWHTAVQAAVVLAIVALGTVVLRHLGGSHRAQGFPGPRPAPIAIRMAAIQITAFVAMEVTERLLAGAPVATLLGHHVLLVGVLAQILVAGAGALGLVWFSTAAARLSAGLGRPALTALPALVIAPSGHVPSHRPPTLRGAAGVRGPPSS